MKIVWDEIKRQSNLDKHGLDFADLTNDFFLSSTIVPAKKGRQMAIGALSGGIIATVFVRLGREGLSVITCGAPASKKERSPNEDTQNIGGLYARSWVHAGGLGQGVGQP